MEAVLWGSKFVLSNSWLHCLREGAGVPEVRVVADGVSEHGDSHGEEFEVSLS